MLLEHRQPGGKLISSQADLTIGLQRGLERDPFDDKVTLLFTCQRPGTKNHQTVRLVLTIAESVDIMYKIVRVVVPHYE